ncbi:MAG: hypothetical protein LQ338_007781, partial [Usnochroma carphineum]
RATATATKSGTVTKKPDSEGGHGGQTVERAKTGHPAQPLSDTAAAMPLSDANPVQGYIESATPQPPQGPKREEEDDDGNLSALPDSDYDSSGPLALKLPGATAKRRANGNLTPDGMKRVPITNRKVDSTTRTMETLHELVRVLGADG